MWYNFVLGLLLLGLLPKWLIEWIRDRKHRRSFAQKLGWQLPSLPPHLSSYRIWIHAISVGEVRAAQPLIQLLRQHNPSASFLVSTVSETGQDEARRILPEVDLIFYMPLDFSWVVRKFLRHLQPTYVVLVEGDIWWNFIKQAPRVMLVNGKMSARSFRRFKRVPFFSRKLFSSLSLVCVQTAQYAERLIALGAIPERVVITGNLKWDTPIPSIDTGAWRKTLHIESSDVVVTVGSTHAPEEREILTALMPLFAEIPHLKVLIVPRHPERFFQVGQWLQTLPLRTCRLSCPPTGVWDVQLIDVMGKLTACYAVSRVAIVGGSFVAGVGGHNILEPVRMGVPVLFGQMMHAQQEMVQWVKEQGAGKQVSLSELLPHVRAFLAHPPRWEAGDTLQGAAQATLEAMMTIRP